MKPSKRAATYRRPTDGTREIWAIEGAAKAHNWELWDYCATKEFAERICADHTAANTCIKFRVIRYAPEST